jgi:hypothetical protein
MLSADRRTRENKDKEASKFTVCQGNIEGLSVARAADSKGTAEGWE